MRLHLIGGPGGEMRSRVRVEFMPKLTCKRVHFFSPADEAAFFSFVRSIKQCAGLLAEATR